MTEYRHRVAAREWLDGFIARMKAPDAATSTFANDLSLADLLARVESEAALVPYRAGVEASAAVAEEVAADHERIAETLRSKLNVACERAQTVCARDISRAIRKLCTQPADTTAADELRDLRERLAKAEAQVAALRADLVAVTGPDYDCPACDRGVLRQCRDGREPQHWDDCPAARTVATLAYTAAAAQEHDERIRAEEWERCVAALSDPALLEVLADAEHQRWAAWMRYQQTAPPEKRADWVRKVALVYWGLTDEEQESDRAEARKTLEIIRNRLRALSPSKP